MVNITHDIFLLMNNLSQLTDRARLMTIFTEAINSLHPDFSIQLNNGSGPPDAIMEICTAKKQFGYVRWNGDMDAISSEFSMVFQNAVQMLAVILEKLEQEELLANETLMLKNLVEEQTRSLIQSEQFLRTIADNFPNAFLLIIEKDLTISYLSGQECKNQHINPNKYLGQPVHSFFTEHTDQIEQAYLATFNGEQCSFEITIGGKWLLNRTVPLYENDGSISHILSVIENITNRKLTNDALLEREKLLKATQQLAKVGGWEWDLKNQKMYWTEETYRIHGLEPGDIPFGAENHINRSQECYEEKDRAAVMESFNRCVTMGKPYDFEVPFTTFSGERKWIRTNARAEWENGEIVRVIGNIMDITEHKHLEEQLQVRERMDSIGTLAGGIAHDFNNLLTGIIGNLDMVLMDKQSLTPDQQESLEESYKLCHMSARLIRNYQSLSSITINAPESVDIHQVAKEVFSILERSTDRLIKKEIAFEPGMFHVEGHHDQLHQVLLNLGTNAFQAIEEKGITAGDFIKINAMDCLPDEHVRFGLPEGRYIHISFSDSGIGMSEEIQHHAFEPLFSTKERGTQKGQGLGLAMVYNIITSYHNGLIEIESKQGHGTTFHIYLPKLEKQEQKSLTTPVLHSSGNETILIIEDEESVVSLIERALTKYGYSVLTAQNGESGLDLYLNHRDRIDMIILDITLPNMSGATVLEKIITTDPNAKVLISSGHSEKELSAHSKAKGYVAKPYKLETLAHTIREVLDDC